MLRRSVFFLTLLLTLIPASVVHAAPRDKAAQKKIEEAIFTDFLNMDFDAAEGLLLGTIRACEDKCSAEVMGKAWMYVGVVRGSGRSDLNGAQDAFKTALAADPNVALDDQVATDPVKALFAKLKGGAPATAPGNDGSSAPPPAESAAFTCTPSPSEIETRRPVPMQCETDAQVDSATLHYKTYDGSWGRVNMEEQAGTWRGTIPCDATQNTGTLRFYVEGKDSDGKVVAKLGEKSKPHTADVVSETSADPPAYPEEEPPARCSVMDTSARTASSSAWNCGASGEACGQDNCCQGGLSCSAGTCQARCETDSDCSAGAKCNDGQCEGGSGGKGGAGPKNWLGLHFGVDVGSISQAACTGDSAAKNVTCFEGDGSTYEGTPSAVASGLKNGGFALATMAVMASYERLFGAVGLEGRIGFAFNGGGTPDGGKPFLPVHAEARVKYWLLGAGQFSKKGLRPWLHVGGGLAQVDVQVKSSIYDCPAGNQQQRCQEATDAASLKGIANQVDVKVTKTLGLSFVTAGGGVMYAVSPNNGPVLNVNLMIPFPSTGFVFEPSIGYEFGF